MSSDIERKKITIERKAAGITKNTKDIRRGKPQLSAFQELFDEPDIEIDMPDTEDFLDDISALVSEVEQTIRANRKKSEADYAIYDDEKFYCCLVFQTEQQKIDFLNKAGWLNTMEYNNFENMYINGLEIARRIGIQLDIIELPFFDIRGNPEIYRKEVIINAPESSQG